ncbi:MAG: DUF488 domain-containing protein [Firmicutes bacterium]|nr:DUF488 domain-containing protein [Bacillota bacterium]
MKLFTIGFTKKSAKEFFGLLKSNSIKKIIDIRLNNSSQLAGFTKGNDLKYFLEVICNIDYEHDMSLAPTQEILDGYKKKIINWDQYEQLFKNLLFTRNSIDTINFKTKRDYDYLCLLCSELSPKNCHRRLVAEYIKENNPSLSIEIIHL